MSFETWQGLSANRQPSCASVQLKPSTRSSRTNSSRKSSGLPRRWSLTIALASGEAACLSEPNHRWRKRELVVEKALNQHARRFGLGFHAKLVAECKHNLRRIGGRVQANTIHRVHVYNCYLKVKRRETLVLNFREWEKARRKQWNALSDDDKFEWGRKATQDRKPMQRVHKACEADEAIVLTSSWSMQSNGRPISLANFSEFVEHIAYEHNGNHTSFIPGIRLFSEGAEKHVVKNGGESCPSRMVVKPLEIFNMRSVSNLRKKQKSRFAFRPCICRCMVNRSAMVRFAKNNYSLVIASWHLKPGLSLTQLEVNSDDAWWLWLSWRLRNPRKLVLTKAQDLENKVKLKLPLEQFWHHELARTMVDTKGLLSIWKATARSSRNVSIQALHVQEEADAVAELSAKVRQGEKKESLDQSFRRYVGQAKATKRQDSTIRVELGFPHRIGCLL